MKVQGGKIQNLDNRDGEIVMTINLKKRHFFCLFSSKQSVRQKRHRHIFSYKLYINIQESGVQFFEKV